MEAVERWRSDLGLGDAAIVAVAEKVMRGRRGGPPATLRYFDQAMRREAVRIGAEARPAGSSAGPRARYSDPEEGSAQWAALRRARAGNALMAAGGGLHG